MSGKIVTTVRVLIIVAMMALILLVGMSGSASAGGLGSAQGSSLLLSGTTPTSSRPGAPLSPVGSAFTYQGRLTQSGSAANGQFDLVFIPYAVASGGNQLTAGVTLNNQTITNGLFTVSLDFGPNFFQGQATWLELQVRPANSGSYTTLSPRQPLTAAPSAMTLAPGALISDTLAAPMLKVTNGSSAGTGLFGTSSSIAALDGGVYGRGLGLGGNGVIGEASNGTSAYGVYGISTGGHAVHGNSSTGFGVYGLTSSDSTASGVYGKSNGTGGVGVWGEANNGYYAIGVLGRSASAQGVGVYGEADVAGATAIYGYSTAGTAMFGYSHSGYAVYGQVSNVYGGYAGYFNGNVQVLGTLSKSAGSFKIDDPIDPANKYLSHSFVESPDMMNIYNGEATLDSKGEAIVTMPKWFEALNRDFRYQLTAVGGPGPNLYVAQKISGNTFKVAGGTPNMEVSWQVTGIRHDAYADAHRIPVEEDKKGDERGLYLQPELYGQPSSKSTDKAHATDGQHRPVQAAPAGNK